ncbi:unnamed protein product [Mytilus edulis]|uniref:Uncharacterized protein n=1 Tax=Mytilus edulis TaxID=6550 RepID=A0A8S3T2T5_MYTED|nr:unnamed protein product [Mytilus edulis]
MGSKKFGRQKERNTLYKTWSQGPWHARCYGGALRMNFGPQWSCNVWESSTGTEPGLLYRKLYAHLEQTLANSTRKDLLRKSSYVKYATSRNYMNHQIRRHPTSLSAIEDTDSKWEMQNPETLSGVIGKPSRAKTSKTSTCGSINFANTRLSLLP